MKIAVVNDSISRAAGGLFDAERRLWQSLRATGVSVSAFALADEFSSRDLSAWLPIVPELFASRWPRMLARSPSLRARLLAEPADLLYRAGLWTFPSGYSHEWARRRQKPEIIAPHGMLDPWAIRNSWTKKKLALAWYERRHLQSAACLRALCPAEAQAIRDFGLRNPIAIIPNGIDLPNPGVPSGETESPLKILKARHNKVLFYLGRIHPKKGLANLLKAWAAVLNPGPSPDWVLAIAGWDQGGHENELKRLAAGMGLTSSGADGKSSVVFLGPQFNQAKAACYQDCDAFVLPSLSEGLPMAVLEAWAHEKPVLMTPACNIPQGFAAAAAIRAEPTIESLQAGLRVLFGMSSADLETMGQRGLDLVKSRFVWPNIAAEMKALCEWLLGAGPKPSCLES